MEPKKNPEVNLERKRGLFLQIGLAIALLIVLAAFEHKTYEKKKKPKESVVEITESDRIPPTEHEPPPKLKPPPPPPEVIEIVEDEEEIEETILEDTETDEEEEIEIEIIEVDDAEVFMVVEDMPEFPGGDLGLMKYIQKNVKYPPIAKEYNITGKVYVQFIVNKSGSVTNVKIVRSVDKNLDAEALRVVRSLPKYKPGKQRGKPVSVQYTIPINFTLN